MNERNQTPFPRNRLFDTIDEESVQEMRELLDNSKDILSCYRCAIMEMETKFRVLNDRFTLYHDRNPIDNIQSRLKSAESICEKLVRKNLPFTIEAIEQNIFDIAGLRVVCSFIDDIYMLADCLLQQDDVTLIAKKDYIKNPKSNGYRSLHLIVEIPIFLQNEKRIMKVEVQLRTIAMEFWANLEHQLRYKKDVPPNIHEKTATKLYQCAKLSSILDGQMKELKDIIFNYE